MEQVKIASVPKITFAHNHTTEEKYVNHLPAIKDFFELGYSRYSTIKGKQGDLVYSCAGGGVSLQTREKVIDVEADGVFETHCIGVSAEHQIGDVGRIWFSIDDKETDRIKEIIDEIILLYNFHPERENKMCSLIFEAFDLINEKYKKEKEKGQDTSGEIYYVNKIKKYVKTHVADKINLKDIAKLLRVSVSYLCIVFKKLTGESIITYANKYRLYLIKNYVVSQNMTLKEACSLVGISDTAYASRLFKKHEKQSLREFKGAMWENPKRLEEEKDERKE